MVPRPAFAPRALFGVPATALARRLLPRGLGEPHLAVVRDEFHVRALLLVLEPLKGRRVGRLRGDDLVELLPRRPRRPRQVVSDRRLGRVRHAAYIY
jgi:hypothetical protein